MPGVLFVRGVQREFEDLLAVLIFSPEHGNRWLRSFAGAQATSSIMLAFRERRQRQVPLIYTMNPRHECRGFWVLDKYEFTDALLYKISFFMSEAPAVAPGAIVIVALPV